MLSYRHAFHAGNYADVLKHLVLVKSLEHLLKKDSPIVYIDTHAGAGLYKTQSAQSKKTGEFAAGYNKLDFLALGETVKTYRELTTTFTEKKLYPGSPMIAASMLRKQDQLRLFELHPSDLELLQENMRKQRRAKIESSDGFAAPNALLPIAKSRALVLMDPSYELKTDYDDAVKSIEKGYKKMPHAMFLLWYPVVERQRIATMIKRLRQANIKDAWQIELGIAPDSTDYGMTASGMFVINPPWTLADDMRQCLPTIAEQIAKKAGFHLVERLTDE